eukprot:2481827-Amphidinium_carterae.1
MINIGEQQLKRTDGFTPSDMAAARQPTDKKGKERRDHLLPKRLIATEMMTQQIRTRPGKCLRCGGKGHSIQECRRLRLLGVTNLHLNHNLKSERALQMQYGLKSHLSIAVVEVEQYVKLYIVNPIRPVGHMTLIAFSTCHLKHVPKRLTPPYPVPCWIRVLLIV